MTQPRESGQRKRPFLLLKMVQDRAIPVCFRDSQTRSYSKVKQGKKNFFLKGKLLIKIFAQLDVLQMAMFYDLKRLILNISLACKSQVEEKQTDGLTPPNMRKSPLWNPNRNHE